jgi:hypothetical protein
MRLATRRFPILPLVNSVLLVLLLVLLLVQEIRGTR